MSRPSLFVGDLIREDARVCVGVLEPSRLGVCAGLAWILEMGTRDSISSANCMGSVSVPIEEVLMLG